MNVNAKLFGFVFIFITLLGTVMGQLSIKKGLLKDAPGEFQLFHTLWKGFTNPLVILGLVFACIAASSWILALSRMPLSYAYPFLSLSFPIVVILSSRIFHEPISSKTIVGLGFIILGLIIGSGKL